MKKYLVLALTAFTLVGCGSSGASSADMTKELSVKILTEKIEFAEGENVVFDSNVTGSEGAITYEWKEGNLTLGTDANLYKNDFTLGNHTVVLNIENGDKTATDSKTIKVSEFLVSLNSLKTTYDKDENITVKADINGNTQSGVSYAWMKDGVSIADTTSELNITDFNLSNHTVLVIASVNGIEKNATIDINVSDFSDLNVTSVLNDDVIIQKTAKLMWVSDMDKTKKACLAIHHDKQEEITESQTFCSELNFAGKDNWRKPTVSEVSNFITSTISANILPAYYAPCKILIGTDGSNSEKAVVTRYGKDKFGVAVGEVLGTVSSVQTDANVSKRKNIGLRCVRDN